MNEVDKYSQGQVKKLSKGSESKSIKVYIGNSIVSKSGSTGWTIEEERVLKLGL